MKKLFIFFVMLLAGSAWAEWVVFGETETATSYFDPATIRKDGNMRRVWQLQDLREQGKIGEMSRRIRYEYDLNTTASKSASSNSVSPATPSLWLAEKYL